MLKVCIEKTMKKQFKKGKEKRKKKKQSKRLRFEELGRSESFWLIQENGPFAK